MSERDAVAERPAVKKNGQTAGGGETGWRLGVGQGRTAFAVMAS